jgi:hypothetical protein
LPPEHPNPIRDEVEDRSVAKFHSRIYPTATSQGGVEAMCGGRRFLTKEEKLEWLEDYKTDLENELKGVAERIEELKH